jgi:hypothetical protein
MVQSPYLGISAIKISKLPRSPLLGRLSVYCPEDGTRRVLQLILAPCSKTGLSTSSSVRYYSSIVPQELGQDKGTDFADPAQSELT